MLLFLAWLAPLVALGGAGLYLGSSKALAQVGATTRNSPNGPDLVRLVGPVAVNADLRDLPYIPPAPHIRKEKTLDSDPWDEMGAPLIKASRFVQLPGLTTGTLRPVPTMPTPLLTFNGISRVQGGNGVPPDTNGDVGPNHYVQAVNDAFKVFDKNGNTLSGPTTFNTFFRPLGNSTPCGANQNQGDPFVFYDQMADRWVISDFAFPRDPGTSFFECIGVSQTGDPVAGGWFLYALQDDPAHPVPAGKVISLPDSAGQLGTASSSARFKKEIKPMDKVSEAILGLKPVTFQYKTDNKSTPQFGLIAEEVEKVNPDLVVRDENGEIYTVRYDAVNAMLLNEFLKARRQIDAQQKQIDALTAGLQKVSAQLEASRLAPQVVNNP